MLYEEFFEYNSFFGLKDTPFNLSPDPEYFFPSVIHKDVLQALLWGIHARQGVMQLSGPPGTGKTLILKTLISLLKDEVNFVVILNPLLSPIELLVTVVEDLTNTRVPKEDKSQEKLLRYFRAILIEHSSTSRNNILIIDEAQQLPEETLEALVLLSNLETEKNKLLQIILTGQVDLEKRINTKKLRQLYQRITIRCHLKPLSRKETLAYIKHRIEIAGGGRKNHFSNQVLNEIYKFTKGVPRLINVICDRTFIAAFIDLSDVIKVQHVEKAIEKVQGTKGRRQKPPTNSFMNRKAATIVMGLAIIIALMGGAYLFLADNQTVPQRVYTDQRAEAAKNSESPKSVSIPPDPTTIHASEPMLTTETSITSRKPIKTANSGKITRPPRTAEIPRVIAPPMEPPQTTPPPRKETRPLQPKPFQTPSIPPTAFIRVNTPMEAPATNTRSETAPQSTSPDESTPGRIVSQNVEDEDVTSPMSLSYPYSLQLASFQSLTRAERAVSIYEKIGLNTYWVKVSNNGTSSVYRIFYGCFKDTSSAYRILEKHRGAEPDIKNSIVRKTPYANLIGNFTLDENLYKEIKSLTDLGFSPYTIELKNGTYRLFVGAFVNKSGAERLHEELAAKGILSRIVER